MSILRNLLRKPEFLTSEQIQEFRFNFSNLFENPPRELISSSFAKFSEEEIKEATALAWDEFFYDFTSEDLKYIWEYYQCHPQTFEPSLVEIRYIAKQGEWLRKTIIHITKQWKE